MILLQVDHLCKSFGGVRAVQEVSFGLERGHMLALIGPNGAGKSTCFNLLNGQLRPDAGRIRLNGKDILGLPPRKIWRLGVGRTFQIAATFSSMSVSENIQMVLLAHHRGIYRLLRPARHWYRSRALELLECVGMVEQAERACGVLAYGDVKRVELAMAIAHDPTLLLMDEPTAGMAAVERGQLMTLVARLVEERNMAVLFTEHSMDVVFGFAQRVLVLSRGSLVAEGTPAEVRNNPQVQAVYLGSGAGTQALHEPRA
jgi:branched-chain amino acid transport system ATP-binding protein